MKAILGAAGMLVAVLIFFGIRAAIGGTVDQSHVGVVQNWGNVNPDQVPLQPGYYGVNPFGGMNVIEIDTRPQVYHFKEVQGAGSDGQAIYFDAAVAYQVRSQDAAKLVIKGGSDNPTNAILSFYAPQITSDLKAISPHYSIVPGSKDATGNSIYVLDHRDDIATQLQHELEAAQQYGLDIIHVSFPNIHADAKFDKAVEDTAIAQQALAKARADAAAAVQQAQGVADANRIKQQGISDKTLQQQQLDIDQAIAAKWDGHLPATWMGGQQLPFVNIPFK